ncbi:uncharacterized protein si:ch211-13c6.2 isoform X1 [Thunnus albacares]|uniref:uncharacterized protein si:ch211-13c6.2 isoform X1 n=2 Tax=Thunnus albacares TaxID=8236 RepID=UPI001CF6DC04|nr:uncharacterized protein si:ch211-13c6.2 isoform X1 [Thunnus albacares]
MDSFETPYEDEASTEFIECTVCEKSIRGDTLYKIHLTTPGHIKKEDAFVAAGLGGREHTVPLFEDILQYLEYLKLDEPIIGLKYLDEVPNNMADQHAGPRYTCRLCNVTANLPDMVHHVIGRKHRQKYMEVKRPDLVTWDKQSIMTQGGKIIRARAEIIERQDGRGSPLPMKKKGTVGKLNISRVPPRQKQNRDLNIPHSVTQRHVSPHPPELKNYQDEYSPRGRRYSPGFPTSSPSHSDDRYTLNSERQMYPREDTFSCDRREEELWRADYRERNMHRQQYLDSDHRREYEDEYVEEPQTRAVLEPGDVHKYDSGEEMPHGQAQHVEYYPEEAPPYRRPYPEKDQLKEFYTEEVRRGRVHSASSEYQPLQPVYPEDNKRQWSLDRESGRHESRNRAGRQGSSEPEAKRRSFPALMESEQTHFIRDYQHKTREPYQEEAFSNARPSRTGPPTFQRPMEVTRSTSDIPEPFRNFLKGTADDEGYGKRKRKSRFSDATAEEMETANEMFHDDSRPPNPKFGGRSRPGGAPFEPEIHGTQHPDLYTESQSPHDTDSYQRGRSEPGGVFDMLKNIEIENAEEAEFLKNKLCNLLKEFKAKKSEKIVQNSHSRAVISKDYNSLTPDMQLSPQHQYKRTFREDLDIRQSEDLYVEEDHRRRSRKQHEHKPDERHQEYHHPVHGEPRRSNRRRYEEIFGMPEMYQAPHATRSDEPARYPERFQEHMQPRDYRPDAEELFDSHSFTPPLHMERGPRTNRGSQYSNSLDKITSTLLELVARK